jgi:hypothetical protein
MSDHDKQTLLNRITALEAEIYYLAENQTTIDNIHRCKELQFEMKKLTHLFLRAR